MFSWKPLTIILVFASVASAGWIAVDLIPENSRFDEDLESLFWNVSTPNHEQFRKFASKLEVCAILKASQSSVTAAAKALRQLGAKDVRVGFCEDVIFARVDTMVDVVAKLKLPAIRRVRKLCASNRVKSKNNKGATATFPGMTVDIFTIRARYGIPTLSDSTRNSEALKNYSQAVAEFEQEQFYQKNIAAFNSYFDLPEPIIKVRGPNSGGYFGEGNLDLEYINGLTPVTTWWVADNEFDISRFVETLLTVDPLPAVVSISWGGGESGYSRDMIDADNTALKKLGSLGVTVLAASGDQGTGSTGFFSCGTFDPSWPASSPYLTAVGGLFITSNSSAESGWSGSGGGFSTVASIPSYQTNAVSQYFRTNVSLPAQQYWTRGGRATPDVSALATNFRVYSNGWGTETGTSAATPTFAAVISRINVERILSGKSQLGFLNPSLYKLGRVGADVTVGENRNPACPSGFSASSGWDPVTGLGSPDYSFLKNNL